VDRAQLADFLRTRREAGTESYEKLRLLSAVG
jgi:hypothetical protein